MKSPVVGGDDPPQIALLISTTIKFGPTCVTLYSYDMLGKRTTGKIKYSDITILK